MWPVLPAIAQINLVREPAAAGRQSVWLLVLWTIDSTCFLTGCIVIKILCAWFATTAKTKYIFSYNWQPVFTGFKMETCVCYFHNLPHIIWIELDSHIEMLLQQCSAVKVPPFSAFRIFHRRERGEKIFTDRNVAYLNWFNHIKLNTIEDWLSC